MPTSSVPTAPATPVAAPVPGKRQAIASLVLGCIGWYLVGTIIGPFICGAVGVPLGISALRKINQTTDRLFRGHAIAGICISALAIAATLLIAVILLVLMPAQFDTRR